MSALRTAMTHFYGATAITVAVRDYHMTSIGKSFDETPGIWDLYLISRASLALISYRYRAQDVPVDQLLRDDLASQYKLVTGIFMIVREMILSSHDKSQSNDPISAQALYDFADENEIFKSPSGMVCAGSTGKIIEFLEFANMGRKHPNSEKLGFVSSDDDQKLLKFFVADLAAWYRYALLTVELDYYIQLKIFHENSDIESASVSQTVVDTYRNQQNYWQSLINEHAGHEHDSFYEGVLLRQNKILLILGKSQINNIPRRLIDSRLKH